MIKRRRGAITRFDIQARHVQDDVDKFGRPSDTPTYTPFTAERCTVQPYVGGDLLVAADGFGDKEVYTVFTDTYLSQGKEGGLEKPDEVFIFDEWYRVAKTKRWQNGVINHYECVVVKIDEGLV